MSNRGQVWCITGYCTANGKGPQGKYIHKGGCLAQNDLGSNTFLKKCEVLAEINWLRSNIPHKFMWQI